MISSQLFTLCHRNSIYVTLQFSHIVTVCNCGRAFIVTYTLHALSRFRIIQSDFRLMSYMSWTLHPKYLQSMTCTLSSTGITMSLSMSREHQYIYIYIYISFSRRFYPKRRSKERTIKLRAIETYCNNKYYIHLHKK